MIDGECFHPKDLFFSPKVLTYPPIFIGRNASLSGPPAIYPSSFMCFGGPLHVWLIISCHGNPEISRSFLHIPFCFTHFLFTTFMYNVHLHMHIPFCYDRRPLMLRPPRRAMPHPAHLCDIYARDAGRSLLTSTTQKRLVIFLHNLAIGFRNTYHLI